MLTAAGSGYSRWREVALTRWREDPTCDPFGYYVFLRDVVEGRVWSAGYQPVGCQPGSYDAAFFEDRAKIPRRDGPIRTAPAILRPPRADPDVRRAPGTKTSHRKRRTECSRHD